MMMNNFAKGLCLISLILLSACSKEEGIHTYQVENYARVLDSIDIVCVEAEKPYFIKALINRVKICHYDSIDGRTLHFGITSKFTTASPTITTSDPLPSNARRGMQISIKNPWRDIHEFFRIEFPDFALERNPIAHLDSLFRLEEHEVMGSEDVRIPPEADLVEEGLLKINGGYLNQFIITMNAVIRGEDGTGGNAFRISTLYGPQNDSFVRFRKVEKTLEDGDVYYYIEMEFQCDLYHWPHYGQEGLWGRVTEGLLVAKFEAR